MSAIEKAREIMNKAEEIVERDPNSVMESIEGIVLGCANIVATAILVLKLDDNKQKELKALFFDHVDTMLKAIKEA